MTAFLASTDTGILLLGAILLVTLLCYAFFVTQIMIHACSHYALTGIVAVDTLIGCLLSVVNFHTFAGWRALHLLHHRFTNIHGKDPACPRAGEKWGVYLFTALHKMVKFTRTPFYRQHTSRGVLVDRLERSGATSYMGRTVAAVTHAWEPLAGFTGLAVYTSVSCCRLGAAGILLPLTTWVIPWVAGQMLMADFNYRTHEGCPPRGGHRPYTGEDTNSLHTGIWRVFNALTFGFYRHREHHIDPNLCLWFFGQPHYPHKRASGHINRTNTIRRGARP
jgi:fatty acid desaturase